MFDLSKLPRLVTSEEELETKQDIPEEDSEESISQLRKRLLLSDDESSDTSESEQELVWDDIFSEKGQVSLQDIVQSVVIENKSSQVDSGIGTTIREREQPGLKDIETVSGTGNSSRAKSILKGYVYTQIYQYFN